jgi:drug/metabolite transporter (DMT)-like permease
VPFALALTYLVLGNSLLAISLLLMMIRRGEATRVSALFFLVPPTSAFIAWLVLDESMSQLGWAGMAVAAVGVWMASQREKSTGDVM